MSHLVEPPRKGITLTECHAQIQEAHDFLVSQAKKRFGTLQSEISKENSLWGTEFKRLKVILSKEKPLELIGEDQTEHSFVEVVNQCATIERLLAALAWASSRASRLSSYRVHVCHPTTSSNPKENDLELRGSNESCARFEISDVASGKDGNGKELKDLERLEIGSWPAKTRFFMVVSREFAERLKKQNSKTRSTLEFQYEECHQSKDAFTCILEVLPTR